MVVVTPRTSGRRPLEDESVPGNGLRMLEVRCSHVGVYSGRVRSPGVLCLLSLTVKKQVRIT